MLKFGTIGVGNMATAILGGILKNNVIEPDDIMLCDRHPERHDELYSLGIKQAADECEVVKSCKFVLLSIKPQGFAAMLEKIKPFCSKDNVFISIAAGISADHIKDALGYDAKVVLVMPNTPVSLGFGTSALANVAPTTEEEFATALDIFSACGEAVEIPADKMNEVIPFNGSSPAFIYRITQIFVDRAVSFGFDRDTAMKLFCSTLIGASHMMTDSGIELEQLIKMVCSKGGTTIAGLEAMAANGLEHSLQQGIDDCVKRAYELGKK